MGKKRNLRKKPNETASDESDHSEEVVVKRKPLRSKSSLQNISRNNENCCGKDHYDADSEPDEKQDDISMVDIGKLSSRPKPFTKCKMKPASSSTKENISHITDFSINLDDCMRGKKFMGDKLIQCSSTEEKKKLPLKEQENVTPPDLHCATSILNTAKNLDDSLFGFNAVERKLEYSVASCSTADISVKSHSKSLNKSVKTYEHKSFSKRKYDLGFDDVPMEGPKKQNKRKKRDQVIETEKEKELWENLRLQFEEVEMHELIVE